jgi:hypothetical protein
LRQQILRDLIICILAIALYGYISGGLFSKYVFHLGDPALIGGMIKNHAEKWKNLEFDFSEQRFFYPYKSVTFFTENFIGQGFLFAPFSNLSVVQISHLTYWLAQLFSLFAMIQIIRTWTHHAWIPYFVSVLWVFNPARALGYASIQGNFQNIWDFPVLLSIFALSRWFQTPKLVWACTAIFCFWMQYFFSVVYPAFAGLVILWIFTIAVCVHSGQKKKRFPLLLLNTVSIAGYLILLTPYREVGNLFERVAKLEQIQSFSNTISSTFSLPINSALGKLVDSIGFSIAVPRSSYPGLFLLFGFIWSLRNLRTSLSTRWSIVLVLVLWVITLGPIIQWSYKDVLFANPIWLWTIDKIPSIGSIRVPYRIVIGLHWVLAWQLALVLDRSLLADFVEKKKIYCLLGLPAMLCILFLTEMKVDFLTTNSQKLAEPVHNRIAANSVVLELPTGFGSPVRFRTVALAVEKHFKTVDGQAAFLTPLAGHSQFISQIGVSKKDIALFRSLGLTYVVLHCHDFEKGLATKDLCKKNMDILMQAGFEIIYKNNSDILLQDTKNVGLAMIYDSIDFHLFKLTLKKDDEGTRLVLKPKRPVFVAFPGRCYSLKAKLFPTGEVRRICYKSKFPIAERYRNNLPEEVQSVQVLEPLNFTVFP